MEAGFVLKSAVSAAASASGGRDAGMPGRCPMPSRLGRKGGGYCSEWPSPAFPCSGNPGERISTGPAATAGGIGYREAPAVFLPGPQKPHRPMTGTFSAGVCGRWGRFGGSGGDLPFPAALSAGRSAVRKPITAFISAALLENKATIVGGSVTVRLGPPARGYTH